MSHFHSFVILAEMRTGSNFLESNLNAVPGLACHGEAFNPHFIGYPRNDSLLGVTLAQRDSDPQLLLDAIHAEPDHLSGFRYFHDHDPRILDTVLDDAGCAKIILTRNPLDSYVSLKIAQATGQWKLTNVNRRKTAQARFDGVEFLGFVERLQRFQVQVLNRLQRSGQTAFYVAYEDLQDVEVMNGLAAWLGVPGRLQELDQSLKRQNPGGVLDKVENPDEMLAALGAVDLFNLSRTPNFEPRRGPMVPSYVAGARTPLLYLPMRGTLADPVADWLAALDGVALEDLPGGMNQKQLRQWKRKNPENRSFVVLRHPLARAHAVFCDRILQTGPGSFLQIRDSLRRQFKLDIPRKMPAGGYGLDRHRAAFVTYLEFVRANLAGQTGIRSDAAWASQAQIIAGFSDFAPPDLLLREEELPQMLTDLARRLGHEAPPTPRAEGDPASAPFALAEVRTPDIEALVAEIYQRDFLMFGYCETAPVPA